MENRVKILSGIVFELYENIFISSIEPPWKGPQTHTYHTRFPAIHDDISIPIVITCTVDRAQLILFISRYLEP